MRAVPPTDCRKRPLTRESAVHYQVDAETLLARIGYEFLQVLPEEGLPAREGEEGDLRFLPEDVDDALQAYRVGLAVLQKLGSAALAAGPTATAGIAEKAAIVAAIGDSIKGCRQG